MLRCSTMAAGRTPFGNNSGRMERSSNTDPLLRESERRLARVLDGVGGGTYDWDLRTGRVARSSYFDRFLGVESAQVGDDIAFWSNRIHPDEAAHVNELVKAALEAPGGRLSVEYRMRHSDGTWRWIRDEGQVADVDAHGEPTHFVGLVTDVTERKLLEREIIEIANREQQRIGSDLHDGLGQDLTGIALMLRGIVAQLRSEGSPVHLDVEDVIGLVNSAIESTRSLARGLTPVSAAAGGLPAALRALAEKVDERYGIATSLTIDLAEPVELDEATATHSYRIVHEAVTNAIRHSRAENLSISLTAEDGQLSIRVADDGRGFAAAPHANQSDGMGLKIMRYRAQLMGGDFVIESTPGGGTSIHCWYPLRR